MVKEKSKVSDIRKYERLCTSEKYSSRLFQSQVFLDEDDKTILNIICFDHNYENVKRTFSASDLSEYYDQKV